MKKAESGGRSPLMRQTAPPRVPIPLSVTCFCARGMWTRYAVQSAKTPCASSPR